MIRKIVMASAIAVMPIAGLAAVGLPGVASAGGPPPAAASCTLGGSITFPNSGLTMFGDTAKTGSSPVNITSSSAQCTGTNSNVTIKTKSAKCKSNVTTVSFVNSGVTVHPASNIYPTLPACASVGGKASKNDEADSAWGFAGGISVNGAPPVTTAAQLPAELKKGVNVVDGGVTYTLLVTGAGQISPGGACGSNVGFSLSGDVKKFATTSWSANVCLTTDTVAAGTSTSGSFINDLTSLILATGNTSSDGAAPAGPAVNTAITGATIGTGSSLTIS